MARSPLLLLLVSIVGCGAAAQTAPDVLLATALNESIPVAEREKAVGDLARHGPSVLSLMRRIATECKTSTVRAAAIPFLGACRDISSGPMLLAACEDADPLVRGRAAAAMYPILSAKFHFKADDPPDRRKNVIKGMRRSYENLLLSPDVKTRLEEQKRSEEQK
jgi:hypothetical protein